MLVCLDGSPNSELSLPYMLGMARTFGSVVTLVRVLEASMLRHAGPQSNDVLEWEISRREGCAYLERLQAQTSNALERPVHIRLEQGLPAERIVETARDIDADLIVLSSHGEGESTLANLGSTAQQVLAITHVSVFIVHASQSERRTSPRRLLVPLDGSLRTESVLPTAARIANAYGAELLLVHVVQEPLPSLVLRAPEDLSLAHTLATSLELAANRYLQALRDRLANESASVRTLVVRHANERQALLEVSGTEQVDLIVLSAHGSACDPLHSFGSVTTDLLTHSQLPMLVLQDLPEQDSDREQGRGVAPRLRTSHPPEGE